ncbi:hypothetical protein COJ67_24795 [Bacillus thuringiensis]|uniref:hypothetical protein n=1 Tax=Bacillus thuringiensis TaxID=1428 RepID=UPI000BEDC686|nr:hypothetical protein [Bacillus thuringiensis]PEA13674.1 hypothetical protein CON42_20240 [Bacillus thuringiensis]PEV03527.1 hypothetical protein CN417_25480 [Bacillus thuringiensis]PFH71025.1 hypothetical protein COI56_19760 [Bacillus thuringiensis]PFN83666.1 hypothetical protein COJ67_24795 [Bacillus thuringiensis]PGY05275.1 hypothetical protein COE41_04345 [Bacillus thuringiensis]
MVNYIIGTEFFNPVYLFIGHVLNIDILKLMTIQKDGFSVSFVGIVVCYLSIALAFFIIRKF